MKSVKLIIAAMVLIMAGLSLSAQLKSHDLMSLKMTETKTETFKVWGNCDMCKTRIEKAVKAEGAISAEWNKKTKILTVEFDPSRTSLDALGKKLAAVGHDTEKFRATDEVYAKLPGCCKYDRQK